MNLIRLGSYPRVSFSTYHILDYLIFPILPLDFQEVVAEIKEVKATLLSQQDNDGAASPVQPIPKTLPVRKHTITQHQHRHESGSSAIQSDTSVIPVYQNMVQPLADHSITSKAYLLIIEDCSGCAFSIYFIVIPLVGRNMKICYTIHPKH